MTFFDEYFDTVTFYHLTGILACVLWKTSFWMIAGIGVIYCFFIITGYFALKGMD